MRFSTITFLTWMGVAGCSSSPGPNGGPQDGGATDVGADRSPTPDGSRSCLRDGDCGGATPVCDPVTGSCVACLNDARCPGGTYCDATHQCKSGCRTAADCGAPGGVQHGCCNHVCTNLGSSSKHCGACGHDCLGGTCSLAACQPVAVPTYAETFTVDDTDVYFIEYSIDAGTGAIRRAPKGTATMTTLVPQTTGGAIAVDATSVYWLDGPAGTTVWKAPKSGAAVGTMLGSSVRAGTLVSHIAIDADNIYWIGSDNFAPRSTECVWQIPHTGGTISSPYICAGDLGEGLIAADASGLYHLQTAGTQSYLIRELPGAAAHMTLWTGAQVFGFAGVALDPTRAFFTDGGDAGTIATVSKTGGPTSAILTNRVRPAAIAVDSTNVYWIEDDSAVMTAPKAGGTPKTLYTATGHVPGYGPLITDATRVYWLSSNTIMQLAK